MAPTNILIFGEDHNDRTAVTHLIHALSPANGKTNITPLRKPIILARDAKQRFAS